MGSGCWFLVFSLWVAAGIAEAAPKKKPGPIPEPAAAEKYDDKKLWLAPPVAAFVGFGMGHAVQERLRGANLAYTAADGLGYFLVLSSLGDCSGGCRESKRRLWKSGLGVLVLSRVAQIVDVTLWGLRYRDEIAITVDPREGGGAVAASVRF